MDREKPQIVNITAQSICNALNQTNEIKNKKINENHY